MERLIHNLKSDLSDLKVKHDNIINETKQIVEMKNVIERNLNEFTSFMDNNVFNDETKGIFKAAIIMIPYLTHFRPDSIS